MFQAQSVRACIEACDNRIVLFGAGYLGLAALPRARKAGLNVVAFADNDISKSGSKINGVPVMPPALASKQFRDNAIFVITVFKSHDVRAQLENMGMDGLAFPRLARAYPEAFLPFFSLDVPRGVDMPEIERVADLWADAKSRHEYWSQLSWRETLEPATLNGYSPTAETLFDASIIKLTDEEHFVDCGAFDGDTIRQFVALTGGKYAHITAYEPDRINFGNLFANTTDLTSSTVLWSAVGEECCLASFAGMGTVESKIGGDDYQVRMETLDRRLENGIPPTFIKMDIEGSELAALKGAEGIIQKYRPKLAIAAYHKPQDIWEIPAYLKSIMPDYKIYLRRYAPDCWEQIIYAV